MAALAASAVTVNKGWTVVATPYQVKYKQLTLVLTGQGGATNTIDASTLGFGTIYGASNAQLSDDSVIYSATPSYDNTKLFLSNTAVTTDADRPKPVDVTGTVRLLVWGF